MDNLLNTLNPGLQTSQSIMDAINTLVGQYSNAIPLPSISNLNFTAPSVSDLSAKWQEFLDRAAKDPDIVTYYNNLLGQAKGDTTLAINFLEKDYQTGVRQNTDNLKATLQSLGLNFGQEQRGMQDILNQRGIALTDMGQGETQYAGGGLPKTELDTLNESQKLRQEAEQRSSGQKIETMGLSRQKGITSAGQQLQQYGSQLNQQKQSDILNRAQSYYNTYQNQQAAELANKQNQQLMGNIPTSNSYDDRLLAWRNKGEKGDLPIGWEV